MPVLLSSDEFSKHSFPLPLYLVEPMIVQAGATMLHGKPGVGKTQFVMTLTEAVNHGIPFLGRWPTQQGRVVIVQADMSSQLQQDRLLKLMRSSALPGTYWVVERDGSTPLINIRTMSIQQKELVELMQEVDPLLCVWDTLRKVHDMRENESETVVEVLNGARRVLPTATHFFVHHDRKESRDPDSEKHPDEDFMGNQQWKGAFDSQIQLKEFGTSPKRLVCEFHKARTALDTERTPFLLEMDIRDMRLRPLRDLTLPPERATLR